MIRFPSSLLIGFRLPLLRVEQKSIGMARVYAPLGTCTANLNDNSIPLLRTKVLVTYRAAKAGAHHLKPSSSIRLYPPLVIRHLLLEAMHLFLIANIVTTSKALVTSSDALVTTSKAPVTTSDALVTTKEKTHTKESKSRKEGTEEERSKRK